LKIRHIVLAVLTLLAIAFMQPLMTFLGGLAVLIGVGTLIFRDMSPAEQDAVEQRVLGLLRRARARPVNPVEPPVVSGNRLPAIAAEPVKMSRNDPARSQ
jgi:hypothetical protein